MKIAINTCCGGFSLSTTALEHYYNLKGIKIFCYAGLRWRWPKESSYKCISLNKIDISPCTFISSADPTSSSEEIEKQQLQHSFYFEEPLKRAEPELIQTIEELDEESWGCYAELKVVEIPNDIQWFIGEDGTGVEWVAEQHRTWR